MSVEAQVSQSAEAANPIPKAYLIIARYDHEKWQLLDVEKRQSAHATAEKLFPYERVMSLSSLEGVRLITTFSSGFHTRIPAGVGDKPMEQLTLAEWKDRDLAVGAILTSLPRTIPGTQVEGPGTEVDEPGVGWIAVVDGDYLSPFVARMGGESAPLWNMYNVEIIPLNNDQTTGEFYTFMTPVSWNH